MKWMAAIALLLAGCSALPHASPVPALADPPIIIAHRGASGERPEHTQASYTLAIEQGADFIEPDLVLTKDGVLVARHENEISETTDVAAHPEFASRKTSKTIDGEEISGWFTEDFTLAELKTLRARERLPQLRAANSAYDGQFEIPTFEEILQWVKVKEKDTGRRIGLYPETKHPGYFSGIGLPHEAPLLTLLSRYGYTHRDDPVFIQSFEVGNLIALNRKTELRLIQLLAKEGAAADMSGVDYATMATPEGLQRIAAYADGIGPDKAMVIAPDALGRLGAPTSLVRDAHAAGLLVHPWTFRAENYFLPLSLKSGVNPAAQGDLDAEIGAFLDAGVDGLFSDFPGRAVSVRDARHGTRTSGK